MATPRAPRASKPPKGGDSSSSEPKLAPIANDNDGALERPLAPWPQIDRYPTILGSNLTLKYIASVWRLALQGYRQQFVDCLDELLDRDPGTYNVLAQRVLTAALGRTTLTPAITDEEHPDFEEAKAICAMTQARLDAIPYFAEARAQLLWGIYSGIGGQEILWDRKASSADDLGWWVSELSFIHSRRIAYPNWNSFEPYIWDQGLVQPWNIGVAPTQGVYGLPVSAYPDKFILYNGTMRGDYPTRGGLGRIIGWYMAMKIMAVRGAGDYVERFGRPWVIANYSTIPEGGTTPRPADDNDIKVANEATKNLGAGSLASVVIPDNIKVTLDGPGIRGGSGGIDHEKLIKVCNNEIAKAVSGGTLTNDGGEVGARSLGEVHERGAEKNSHFDALTLAETLQRDLINPIVRLNCPGREHLAPVFAIHVERVDPTALLKRAVDFAAAGGRPDAKWVGEQIGIRQLDTKDPAAQALVPVKPVDFFSLFSASASTVSESIQGLASLVGVSLTPAARSALAAMPPEAAAKVVEELLAHAAQAQRDAAHPSGTDAPALPPTPGKAPKGGADQDNAADGPTNDTTEED